MSSLPSPVGVAGFITDTSGNPVSGATVTIRNNNTNVTDTDTTDANGLYVCSLFADNNDLLILTASYQSSSATNSTTVDMSLLTQWINASLSSGISADFTYSPSHPYVDDDISFRDLSLGNPDTWTWRFGDSSTAVGRYPTHSYSEAGTYTVSLKITKGTAEDTCQKNIIVHNKEIYIPPPQPPNYLHGYTVPECYSILDADLPKTDAKLTIVIMDSGVSPQIYNGTDLNKIVLMHHPSFESGYDFFGHGTFVAYELSYIIYKKMPNAKIISYRIFDANGQTTKDIFFDSIEEVKKIHPDVVSLSAGAFCTPDDIYSHKIKELEDMGILVVSAAGNYGPASSTILSPACSPDTFGIGASDPVMTVNVTTDDIVCEWSSRGPVEGVKELKPDIVAPGESIIGPWRNNEIVASGTSLSTPLIAGASAVTLGEHKFLADVVNFLYFWDGKIIPNTLMDSIEESGIRNGDDVYAWGNGIPQFTTASNIFFWKLIVLLLVMIIIIIAIIISVYLVYKHLKRRKNK